MSINDKDIILKVIHIGLRMYGNGYSYPNEIINYISEYCREEIRYYFLKHNQLIEDNSRLSYLHTIIYTSRYKKDFLKRFYQFLQTKDRSTAQQDNLQNKKINFCHKFRQICDRLNIYFENQSYELDEQRSRQYTRLDNYYKSDQLTSNDYLLFIDEQHNSFNNFRLLSSKDILHWIKIDKILSFKSDIRLTEICLFLIKEILLNLMDKVYQSTIPSQINDVLRRQYVKTKYRTSYSRRKRLIR